MNANPLGFSAFTDEWTLFSKHRASIIAGTLLTLMMFLAAAYLLPKKFKSHFTLSIYSQYFQSPLLRDFLPEIYDANEMRSQRESLIRQAFSPQFLDMLAAKYDISPMAKKAHHLPAFLNPWLEPLKALLQNLGVKLPQRNPRDVSDQRKELLSRISVDSLNGTTFQVSFVYSDPRVTYGATQDLYAQVMKTLQDVRANNLTTIRDAIRKRVEALAFNMDASPDLRASLRPQLVREELNDVRNQLRALQERYTEDHPEIKELRDREQMLTHWLQSSPGGQANVAAPPGTPLVGGEPHDATYEIYKDLLRKLNYLNIALESDQPRQEDYFAILELPTYPDAPLWPKRGMFAIWGLAVGLLGSLFLCSLREHFERTALDAMALAHRLGLPLLGQLPSHNL